MSLSKLAKQTTCTIINWQLLQTVGLNYWAFLATDWAVCNFKYKNLISFGRQVIHIHDYDLNGPELINAGLSAYVNTSENLPLPYADQEYAKQKQVIINSLDYSDHESPTIVADLSVPPQYNKEILLNENRYDAVLDIGTTEHVGNPLASIQNAFALLKPGGHYIFDLPYSGWFNHGFFQFCPAFFSDLCRSNNLKLLFQFIHPTSRGEDLYFLRESVDLNLETYHSIFGCIEKPSNISYIAPPSQEFTTIKSDDFKQNYLSSQNFDINAPLINKIHCSNFFDYMSSKHVFPLYWANFDCAFKIGAGNIFKPLL